MNTDLIKRDIFKEVLVSWRNSFADISDVKGCGIIQDVIVELDAQTPVHTEQTEIHIVLDRLRNAWEPCADCRPTCGVCANCYAWDRYGKPQVCEDCIDASNFTPDDNFCSNCGRPMTKKAWAMLIDKLKEMKKWKPQEAKDAR